jgi:hypothetical protein
MRRRARVWVSTAKALLGAIVILTVLAVVPAGAAAATTYFASPNGSGTTCSAGSPCTIVEALAKSTSGDTVVLAGNESSYGTAGSPIIPELQVHDGVVVEGAAGQPMPQIYSHGASAGIRLGEGGTGQVLSNVAIHEEMTGEAVVGSGTISRVLALATSGGGCRIDGPGTTIVDSVCAGKVGIFDVLSAGFGTGVWPLTLRNDTIYGTAEAGLVAFSEAPKFQVAAVNTIVRGPLTTDIETGETGTGTVDVSLAHSNYAKVTSEVGITTVTPAGSGTNQSTAPLFANAAGNDFAELSGSPTIDAGANEAANGSFDLGGNARALAGVIPCPAITDIGAYEYVPASLPPCPPPPSKGSDKKTKIVKAGQGKSKPTISVLRAKIRKRKATFRFEGSGGTIGFECKPDKKPFRSCRSPKTYKRLKSGKHEFSVRAVDAKGKHSKPAKRTFRIRLSRRPQAPR